MKRYSSEVFKLEYAEVETACRNYMTDKGFNAETYKFKVDTKGETFIGVLFIEDREDVL